MSHTSSGQDITDYRIHTAHCTRIRLVDDAIYGATEYEDGCGFNGTADAWWDPEARTGGWTCPMCDLEHDITV